MTERRGHSRRRISRREVVFIILTALWCALIFCLSSQNADDSSDTSGGFIAFICRAAVSGFNDLDAVKREHIIENLQFVVRKAAHFTLYMILAVFSLQTFLCTERLRRTIPRYAAAWGFCVFYAVTDELHQTFVPGRSGELRDVCIDSLGALSGLLLSFAVTALLSRRKNKD